MLFSKYVFFFFGQKKFLKFVRKSGRAAKFADQNNHINYFGLWARLVFRITGAWTDCATTISVASRFAKRNIFAALLLDVLQEMKGDKIVCSIMNMGQKRHRLAFPDDSQFYILDYDGCICAQETPLQLSPRQFSDVASTEAAEKVEM